MLIGAVAVKPPANVKVSVAWLPNVRVPVLLNTVATWMQLMLVLLPCKARLYPLAVVVSVGVVRLSWKMMF